MYDDIVGPNRKKCGYTYDRTFFLYAAYAGYSL